MGICLILTAIVAIAAVLACMLLLICIKFATDRDARREARKRALSASNEQKKVDGDVASAVSGHTTTTSNAEERAGLTKVLITDENED
ncbi:hypothetical protein GCK72_023409 [Caenorhabditis remanei]|uniref:Uncharacterized protein n=2 Tax=Caenorhabditis remanei TaxID=31234 RepID=A0A6A5FWW5_CAERE|nr:hypothetical protein GCK72_023409 [Caenorhabditis remanei]KAF1746951.1 hypothetical protein GCK72_023409 [Caenorhabditis remanei]